MKNAGILVAGVSLGISFIILSPLSAGAQSNAAAGSDALCKSTCTQLAQEAAQTNNPSLNCTPVGASVIPCPYSGPGASVGGQCMMFVCKATSANGLNGGNSLGSLSQLAGQIGQLLGQLMKGSGSGSGSGSSPTSASTGCTSYTPTSDPTQVGVNPCVYYVPSAASELSASTTSTGNTSAQDLLNSLTGTSGGTTASATLSASPSTGAAPLSVTFSTSAISNSSTYTVDPGDGGSQFSLSSGGCSGSSSCVFSGTYTYETAGTYTATLYDENDDTLATVSIPVVNPGGSTPSANSGGTGGLSQVLNSVGGLLSGTTSSEASSQTGESSPDFPGVLGNILLNNNGATIFASTINSANNSETSGFYGSDTLSGQPQGIAAQLCETTPWASNFLADFIPPSFFDSLCQWGGYQVGEPQSQTQPQVTLQQTTASAPVSQPATTTAATSTTNVPPQVVIWAVPSSVPLGSRTSIFWNSQGVTQCTESSPDGSFTENSLSGAAATIPITGATTFTISCLDPNGNPVTDYVTVTISS